LIEINILPLSQTEQKSRCPVTPFQSTNQAINQSISRATSRLIVNKYTKLEIAAQGVAQCEVSATRVIVDAALRRIGKSRLGGHKIANISRDCEWI